MLHVRMPRPAPSTVLNPVMEQGIASALSVPSLVYATRTPAASTNKSTRKSGSKANKEITHSPKSSNRVSTSILNNLHSGNSSHPSNGQNVKPPCTPSRHISSTKSGSACLPAHASSSKSTHNCQKNVSSPASFTGMPSQSPASQVAGSNSRQTSSKGVASQAKIVSSPSKIQEQAAGSPPALSTITTPNRQHRPRYSDPCEDAFSSHVSLKADSSRSSHTSLSSSCGSANSAAYGLYAGASFQNSPPAHSLPLPIFNRPVECARA